MPFMNLPFCLAFKSQESFSKLNFKKVIIVKNVPCCAKWGANSAPRLVPTTILQEGVGSASLFLSPSRHVEGPTEHQFTASVMKCLPIGQIFPDIYLK